MFLDISASLCDQPVSGAPRGDFRVSFVSRIPQVSKGLGHSYKRDRLAGIPLRAGQGSMALEGDQLAQTELGQAQNRSRTTEGQCWAWPVLDIPAATYYLTN